MTNDRRVFLKQAAALAGAFSVNSLFNQVHAADWKQASQKVSHLSDAQIAEDEDFWRVIQQSYTVSPNIINLNNGGVSPSPLVVQQAVERYNQLTNEGPSYYMWRILDQGREPLREKLAELAGTLPDEIAINRNSTEALNTMIYGLDLKAGDEVIGTKQDYPHMIQAYRKRAIRDGIVYKQISFDFPIEDDAEIVKAYEEAITPKTKLIHITHMINWVGQIMPVQKISDMAHAKGIEVLVDGAHSFGLLDFKIPDLHCDYFGTSLHKFLSAPIGSGMLWIKKEKIENVWPMVCGDKPHDGDIRKFEDLGTRSFPIEQGIGEAINFHEGIGSKRKEERIRFLKNYWASKVQHIPKVKLHTSLNAKYSCAICGVSVDGMTPGQLESALFDKYKIHTVGINWENISCVRVTPHVYTSINDLDKLVKGIGEIAAKGKS
ncbi:aminotransferase class V-fold PLP-dependent enzyme [Mucilaginibacter gotjawali]|uniref:Selenocysteine lyase/cysteine desulfurase n=2 Tax=Mucilaginibacter gotjawali TaxID=1550579 RepID=A0A839SDA9_9SPHI|nr:aminotransferase class V-fold PLP-dependent enzyme [Mucilaginibacter gotjawali]MBB3055273.1 selenocysteine lyase/cysteine desulfurase [Mucilaginibacter gotjawali]BAU56108.1 Isopenicillin N epimerase [Mucilaginibacter gotjawali]